MTTTYPIRLKVSSAAMEELQASECGSYESVTESIERGEGDQGRPLESHVHTVTERFATILEIRNDAEAIDAYYAVCSGTFQLSHYRIACRIADALRDVVTAVDPKTTRQWSAPSGM